MIHRKDVYEMTCDKCGTAIKVDGGFDNFIQEVTEKGWFIKKEGDKYTHLCPECVR